MSPLRSISLNRYYISYKLLKSDEAAVTTKTVSFPISDNEVTLTNLKRASKYVITLQAFNGKGAGPVSDEVVGQTLELYPPDKPKLNILAFDFISVTLEWSKEADNPIQGKRGRRETANDKISQSSSESNDALSLSPVSLKTIIYTVMIS